MLLPLLLLALAVLPVCAPAATPDDLRQAIDAFLRAEDEAHKLDRGYESLHLYAYIPLKSTVDPPDRNVLSEIKRLVIFDAIGRSDAREQVLFAAIGSTGAWLLQDRSKIKNDYTEDEIPRLKYQEYYMEGLSDLDFPVMGAATNRFIAQLEGVLAEGREARDGSGRRFRLRRGDPRRPDLPDELGKLEIAFLPDDQIRDVQPGPPPLKFWMQMMDLEQSTPDPEKYITRGAKALYCIEHLYERGAALLAMQAVPFTRWVARAQQQIPPFTPQYLYGGCADMDYFMARAWKKQEQQEGYKTALQVVKYLNRQAWMLQRARDNADKLPDGMTVNPGRVIRFGEMASDLRSLCDDAVESRIWEKNMARFHDISVMASARSCLAGHELMIDMGWQLVDRRREGDLTPGQAEVLKELAYDLATVHKVRYGTHLPRWYSARIAELTEALLREIEAGTGKQQYVQAEADAAQQEPAELAQAEIGPIPPPPVVDVELMNAVMAPAEARRRDRVTFTTTGRLNGLLTPRELVALEQAPPLTDAQRAAMRDLALAAWRAARIRMQIQYLMQTEVRNRGQASHTDCVYVSPHEVQGLTEELQGEEEYIKSLAEFLRVPAPVETTGTYKPRLKPAATLSSPWDYLQELKDSCDRAVETVEMLDARSRQLADLAGEAAGALGTDSDLGRQLAAARKELDDLRTEGAKLAEALNKTFNIHQVTYWSEVALDVKNVAQGGDRLKSAMSLAGKLDEYLQELATQMEAKVLHARRLEHAVGGAVGVLRRCGGALPARTQAGLGPQLITAAEAWDADRPGLLERLPDLEERARWLGAGTWACKCASAALKTVAVFQEYQQAREKLEAAQVSGETLKACMALKACGDTIRLMADSLPIPVLRQVIKQYAGLLSQAPVWASAFAELNNRRWQGEQPEIQRAVLTPALQGLLPSVRTQGGLTADQLYEDPGQFTKINRFIAYTIGSRSTEASGLCWLIWDSANPDGWLQLSADPDPAANNYAFADASRYAAWYQRVFDRRITAVELKDLLVHGRTAGPSVAWRIVTVGMAEGPVTAQELEDRASWILETEAQAAYLGSLLAKEAFVPDELRSYTIMLNQAARALAEEGFIARDEDLRTAIATVPLQPVLGVWWDRLLLFGLARGAWDALGDGERTRLRAAIDALLEQKRTLRSEARERLWSQARADGPAGLTLDDITLVATHALVWPGGSKTSGPITFRPAAEQFAVQWETDLSEDMKARAAYICRVHILDRRKAADEAHWLLDLGGEFIILKTENNTLRIGTPDDLERGIPRGAVLGAGLDGPPVKVEQLEGTGRYASREEALDALLEAADGGGPMGARRVYWKWRPTAIPKKLMCASIGGEEYVIHTVTDTVTLVTETSGVQVGRAWYFPAEEERWVRDRGIVPYVPLEGLYLVHQTGHSTRDGYVRTDHWSLWHEEPTGGRILVPDPYWMGSVFVTDVGAFIGPLDSSYDVAAALAAVATTTEEASRRVTLPGGGLDIGAEDILPPSPDHPPTEALAKVAEGVVERGPILLAQAQQQVKFGDFPAGYVNELLHEDNGFGPDDYQQRLVEHFGSIASSPVEAKRRLMAPLEARAVVSQTGSQPAVVLYPKGTDWRTTGTVFDGWLRQSGAGTPAARWLAYHGEAVEGSRREKDPPVRVAVRGPVQVALAYGREQAGWRLDGTPVGGRDVRLSRWEGPQGTAHYAALPSAATLQLQATQDGQAHVLVRAGEGRLLEYGPVDCRRGERFSLEVRPDGGGPLVGPRGAVQGRPYDLADAGRNQVVLLKQTGSFPEGRGGQSATREYQVQVPASGTLMVVVTAPGPFSFGQSGHSPRCDRIERLDGAARSALGLKVEGGDWKQPTVTTLTTASVAAPGTYIVHCRQAVRLSPTWGDVVGAPPHDYEITVSLETVN